MSNISIHNVSGVALSSAYDVVGNSISSAYDTNGNIWNNREKSSKDLLLWLSLSVDDTANGKRVKERYRMDTNAWITVYRPDCNLETAVAFLKGYQTFGTSTYLTLARSIIQSVLLLQNQNGSFPFSHIRTTVYTNDNSEDAIFLIRAAEIDSENAGTYISVALDIADFLLTTQNQDGSWPVSNENSTKTALFTGHAVSALSTVYQYGSPAQKSNYQAAIENGISFIETQILTGGRVRCCYEVNSSTEFWRAPSSDQAVCVRALALAEYKLPDNPNLSTWENARSSMAGFLDTLISSDGAVRNGPGQHINGADITYYTDHIYTTAFGIEAYLWSWMATNDSQYETTAEKIVEFCNSNLYYSNNQNANGVIRGAYNIRDNNWDTHELTIDSQAQVGSNQLYTGWCNAPIALWLLTFLTNPLTD